MFDAGHGRIEATRRIAGAGTTRVLMLTTFDLDAYVYDAIRRERVASAPDVRPDDLAHAVRTVAVKRP